MPPNGGALTPMGRTTWTEFGVISGGCATSGVLPSVTFASRAIISTHPYGIAVALRERALGLLLMNKVGLSLLLVLRRWSQTSLIHLYFFRLLTTSDLVSCNFH